MKSSFAVAMPVMAAAGALANAHANLHHARAPMPADEPMPRTGQRTYIGCFSSKANLTEVSVPAQYLASLNCGDACVDNGNTVALISPQTCYCGNVYPAKDDKISDSDCNYPCNGYGKETCGAARDAYSLYNLGKDLAPPYYDDGSSSSSSSSTTSASSSTATDSSSSSSSTPSSAVTTPPSSETSKPEKSGGGGPNTAAIAAGVVVGVVVAAAIIGAIIFFVRRKRNAEIEEEHRRNAAVNAFISGSKPPSTSGGLSITDSRLDPVMAHRRLSDGSIADNQDYSRKILRVTNA